MARILLLITIVFLALSAAGPAWGAPLEEIDRLYKSGKTKEALLKVEVLIRDSGQPAASSDEWAWRLARTYYALGKLSKDEEKIKYFDQCLEESRRAVQLNDRSAFGFFFKGLCNGKLGEMKGLWSSLGIIMPLKRDMQAAIRLDPSVDQGGPHRALGKLYLELPFILGGDLDKSIRHLEKAVHYGPWYGENYLFLAQAHYAREHYIPAQNTLQTLLDITSTSREDPEVTDIREQARNFLEKISVHIDPKSSHAQRTEDQ